MFCGWGLKRIVRQLKTGSIKPRDAPSHFVPESTVSVLRVLPDLLALGAA